MRQRVELLGGAIDIGPDRQRLVGARGDPSGRPQTPGAGLQLMTDEGADIAVLLVDDQDLVRSGLRRILRRKDGIRGRRRVLRR